MVSEVINLYLPFLWLRRPRFYVGNPVRAGLKARSIQPWQGFRRKIQSALVKERGPFFFIIRLTLPWFILYLLSPTVWHRTGICRQQAPLHPLRGLLQLHTVCRHTGWSRQTSHTWDGRFVSPSRLDFHLLNHSHALHSMYFPLLTPPSVLKAVSQIEEQKCHVKVPPDVSPCLFPIRGGTVALVRFHA